jgi:2-polyprenyl-6-methoxyphenol hydroxylase-like FAD-dependent oxidoreductase
MQALNVVVLGGGVAGLATALALARSGQRVRLLERDALEDTAPEQAVSWPRNGIPHFLQPHAFIPRGRKEMRTHFPDVYGALLEAGAQEVDLRPKLPGPLRPEDEELAYLGVRRPLIEWALRRAVLSQSGIEVRDRVRITGLNGHTGEVTGVRTAAGELSADLVVDAMGRSSSSPDWLEQIGTQEPRVERNECGVIYYCRYYRVRDGEMLPDGPWIPSPRTMFSYGAYSSFPGDNGTFAAVLAIPPQDGELKVFRHPHAFEAAISTMPALYSWTSRGEPITDVLPMGNLQNTFRHYFEQGQSIVRGFVPVGDALCHTNPMFALGLSQALVHAVALASILEEQSRLEDAVSAYHVTVEPEAGERYALISAADEGRCRYWRGEPLEFAHRSGAYQLFALTAGAATMFSDPDVFRAIVRRNGFLDRVSVLDEDVALQQRIESLFAELISRPRPPAAASREEILRLVESAAA